MRQPQHCNHITRVLPHPAVPLLLCTAQRRAQGRSGSRRGRLGRLSSRRVGRAIDKEEGGASGVLTAELLEGRMVSWPLVDDHAAHLSGHWVGQLIGKRIDHVRQRRREVVGTTGPWYCRDADEQPRQRSRLRCRRCCSQDLRCAVGLHTDRTERHDARSVRRARAELAWVSYKE